MVFLLLVLIVLHLVVRATIKLFENGVGLFLSLVLTLLVLQPFERSTVNEDLPQAGHGCITNEAEFNASETKISVTDANRLLQMERRRDDRISIVEKGRRRQPRQRHFDKVQHHQGLTSPLPLRHPDLNPISSGTESKRAESPSPEGIDVALPVVSSIPASPGTGAIDLAPPSKDTSNLPAIDPQTKIRNQAFHLFVELVNEMWEPMEEVERCPGYRLSKYYYMGDFKD